MYNEERKMQFLTETRSSTDFGASVFNTTDPFEQEAGVDLCELPADTLQEIANKNFGTRTRTMDSTIAFLRAYVSWCKEKGFCAGDGVYQVQTQMDEKMKRFMVGSPRHLQLILDEAFEPVESKTVDCIYRCFLWMGFAGMEDVDAIEVKVSEVDFSTMLIEHEGRSYEICREAVPAFKLACEATEFVYKHPKYEDVVRDRFPGEYLMRGIRSDKTKLTTVKSSIGKLFKERGVEITYGRIRLSGMFYRAYEMERIGEEVNFDGAVAERVAKKERGYHVNYTRNKLANRIKRDLFDDYACWKAAFTGRPAGAT